MMNYGESGDPATTASDPAPVPAPTEGEPRPDRAAPLAIASTDGIGLWECLNEPRFCELAAPDPRTPARLFEGPLQGGAAEGGPIKCPKCEGEKVIYRGDKDKVDAAAPA